MVTMSMGDLEVLFEKMLEDSEGIAPADMKDMDALVKRADTAMYRSKEAGKNRVHVIKS